MDASPALHPTDQTLSDFGLGKLDDGASEAVNSHLEQCVECRDRVAGISGDSFLGRLRDAQAAGKSTSGRSQSGGTEGYRRPNAAGPPPVDTLPPGLADNHDYEIRKELGRGGMGVVYLAHNKLMCRDEVLKVMGRHIIERPGVLDRFLREIRAVARLRHPNIVTAYSATRVGESIVFGMEYVEGLDLAKMVKAKGLLPIAHACNFIHQAALGLQHAHEEGLVHRDIKPGNLMLSRKGNRATIKVLDFGLAKATREEKADAGLTTQGQALGTPDFIAPEQIIDAQSADVRADIYSLGGTLYYLLTARPPFRGNSLYDLYQAHISRDADPLNLVRPEVPTELAALVAKMMAKEPQRRFQTPGEVAEALKPFFKKSGAASASPGTSLSRFGQSTPESPAAGALSTPIDLAINAGEVLVRPKKVADKTVHDGRSRSGTEGRSCNSSSSLPSASGQGTPTRRRWGLVATVAAGVFALVLGVIIVLKWDRNEISLSVAKTDGPHARPAETSPLGSPPRPAVGEGTPVPGRTDLHQVAAEPEPAPDVGTPSRAQTVGDGGTATEVSKAEPARDHRPGASAGEGAQSDDAKPPALTNSIGMTFVKIPAGGFLMGSPDPDLQAEETEKPQQRVKFARPFYLGTHEVTQGQFREIMDVTANYYFVGDDLPADPAIHGKWWVEAVRFCNLLSEREGLRPYYRLGPSSEAGGDGYRLPTDAEWEYACRAGSKTRYPFGDKPQRLGEYAWYKDNAQDKLHPVGQLKPNAWGLYDMLGNAWEICDESYETRKPSTPGPISLEEGIGPRRRRGGACNVEARQCRVAHRSGSGSGSLEGFRVARDLQPESAGSSAVASGRPPFKAVTKATVKTAGTNPPPAPQLVTNSIGLKLAVISPGEFMKGSPDMRSPEADLYAETNEMPPKRVTIAKPFSLGIYEVTVGQYRRVMHENPYQFWDNYDDDYPAPKVARINALAFCNELSELEGLKPYYRFGRVSESGGDGYRLPSEAEWEYACRAGSTSRFSFGDNKSDADAFAWHAGNSGSKLHPVGQLKPNSFGLYDMIGNVWELCSDVWNDNPHTKRMGQDRLDLSLTAYGSARGGSINEPARVCRSAVRNLPPNLAWPGQVCGFRVARDFHEEKTSPSAAKVLEQAASKASREVSTHPEVTKLSPTLPTITNTVGMKLVLIPTGNFLIGSPDADLFASESEKPQHSVRTTKPFYLGAYETTAGQFLKVTNQSPGGPGLDDTPVTNLSWKDAISFCNDLSELEGLKPYYRFGKVSDSGGDGYRLPTEAEWEYACRAGSKTRFTFGDRMAGLDESDWYAGNAEGKVHAVGLKLPNAFGMYDMHGNVSEFCADVYLPDFKKSLATGPLDLSLTVQRTYRGGNFASPPRLCRSSNRGSGIEAGAGTGFRVARDIRHDKTSGK